MERDRQYVLESSGESRKCGGFGEDLVQDGKQGRPRSIVGGWTFEWQAAIDTLIERDAEHPDVGCWGAAEAASLLGCYIGIIFVMPLFAVTAPAIGAEGIGPLAGMRRAWNLAIRRYWRTLGVSWLIGITSFLLSNALGGLPQVLVGFFGFDLAWPLLAAGNILGAVIATPFVAAATVLLYLDLRIRTEGLDLEMSARELLDGAG